MTSLRGMADLVVIGSPAVSESAESYMVCAVADRTLLVAGQAESADSVVAVRDQMERVGVSLLGVAFVERPENGVAQSRVAMIVPCRGPARRIVRVPRHQRHGPHRATAPRTPGRWT